MRISDWSSDVCSSDLVLPVHLAGLAADSYRLYLPVACLGRFVRHPHLAEHQAGADAADSDFRGAAGIVRREDSDVAGAHLAARCARRGAHGRLGGAGGPRSEERRVGKEWVSTCVSRWLSDY